MEEHRHSPITEDRSRSERGSGGRLSSRSNTPDLVANTMESSLGAGNTPDDESNISSFATTPVCCIDSKSHHVPLPPYEPAKKSANSYPICDIPMQYYPPVPPHQVIYANSPSNNSGDNLSKQSPQGARKDSSSAVPVSVISKTTPKKKQVCKPDDLYAKVDKTRRKETFQPKKVQPTYQNTEEIVTVVVKDPKTQTTKVTTEKKSPVDAEDIPREIPNTNIAVAFMVTCCFNLPLGVLAIFCSLQAAKSFRDGNTKLGESRSRWSMIISLLGILITVLIVMAVVLYLAVYTPGSKLKRSSPPKETSDFNI